MNNIKGITERFLKVHGTYSAPKGFARMLGALINKEKSTTALTEFSASQARFRYKVPHTVCRNDDSMPLSATIAVFDELSTVGIIALDKQGRWGASTNLSATMIGKPPKKGDELELSVLYDKFGKTLAFCRMELKDAKSGDLIAVGSHTKYMPVSWLFDNILSIPMIIGAIMNLLFVFPKNSYEVKRTWLGEKLVWRPEAQGVETTEGLDSILSSFGPLAYDESKQTYEFIPGQHHCNPMAFHGGAAAMAAEEACRLSGGAKGARGLRKLDLTYLSAMQKSKSNAISVAVEDVEGADGIVQGRLSQKGVPRVLFQGSF